MTSRRKFLSVLGAALLFPKAVFAEDAKEKPWRWWTFFSGHEPHVPHEKPQPLTWSNETLTAAWIGHATVLINFFGTWIVTDPVFSERIGIDMLGLFSIGPKRLVFPALTLEELPPIDIILLSHAHMDHCDLPTLAAFKKNIPIVIAKNTKDVIEDLGFEKISELDWKEKVTLGDVEIEALQVRHFGWRYPWEPDRSRNEKNGRSFNGYLVTKNGKHLVFGGDTAMCEYFKRIGERNIDVELAIMPIGAYDPWITKHANPEQALAMTDDMHAKKILPIHWNTFIMSKEDRYEPIERLHKAAGKDRIALDTIGATWKM